MTRRAVHGSLFVRCQSFSHTKRSLLTTNRGTIKGTNSSLLQQSSKAMDNKKSSGAAEQP